MKAKASVLTIRVPKELKHKIEQVADEQGVSINQLALYAFTKEIKELETSTFFINYTKSKTKNEILTGFDNVMKKVKKEKVPSWDKL
ncbi:MAG: toxin-antitoxin system HicB family antitoxin [Spirochaetes bacterium]|nr:toxin-antitoxin system HicB family antitoxin [Spirochaetota bacterium]